MSRKEQEHAKRIDPAIVISGEYIPALISQTFIEPDRAGVLHADFEDGNPAFPPTEFIVQSLHEPRSHSHSARAGGNVESDYMRDSPRVGVSNHKSGNLPGNFGHSRDSTGAAEIPGQF